MRLTDTIEYVQHAFEIPIVHKLDCMLVASSHSSHMERQTSGTGMVVQAAPSHSPRPSGASGSCAIPEGPEPCFKAGVRVVKRVKQQCSRRIAGYLGVSQKQTASPAPASCEDSEKWWGRTCNSAAVACQMQFGKELPADGDVHVRQIA